MERPSVYERADHIPQGRQGQVDLVRLLQPLREIPIASSREVRLGGVRFNANVGGAICRAFFGPDFRTRAPIILLQGNTNVKRECRSALWCVLFVRLHAFQSWDGKRGFAKTPGAMTRRTDIVALMINENLRSNKPKTNLRRTCIIKHHCVLFHRERRQTDGMRAVGKGVRFRSATTAKYAVSLPQARDTLTCPPSPPSCFGARNPRGPQG